MGRLVVVKAILPLVPPQVVGLVAKPAESVGVGGFDRVLTVASEPVQPLLVIEKLLKAPADKPLKVNAFEATVIDLGLPVPVKVRE